MHRFPRSVKFTFTPTYDSGKWEITAKADGAILATGKCAIKSQARSDAWHALEKMGLVTISLLIPPASDRSDK